MGMASRVTRCPGWMCWPGSPAGMPSTWTRPSRSNWRTALREWSVLLLMNLSRRMVWRGWRGGRTLPRPRGGVGHAPGGAWPSRDQASAFTAVGFLAGAFLAAGFAAGLGLGAAGFFSAFFAAFFPLMPLTLSLALSINFLVAFCIWSKRALSTA